MSRRWCFFCLPNFLIFYIPSFWASGCAALPFFSILICRMWQIDRCEPTLDCMRIAEPSLLF